MAPIYGIIGKRYKDIEVNFSKILQHRGPDANGIYHYDSKQIALGHTRLSIIDLSDQASQPMADESGKYILTFNGEIYNYQELKKKLKNLGHKFSTNSDTEVVLKSYIQWKERCVNFFRGMFAFCVLDKVENELFLARDRFGIKPLIYSCTHDQFIFYLRLSRYCYLMLFRKKFAKNRLANFSDMVLSGNLERFWIMSIILCLDTG